MDAGAAAELGCRTSASAHARWCSGSWNTGPHPEQGYRACLGLLNLSRTYGEERLEAACRRALTIGSPHRKRIIAILKAKLDQHPDLLPRGRHRGRNRLTPARQRARRGLLP